VHSACKLAGPLRPAPIAVPGPIIPGSQMIIQRAKDCVFLVAQMRSLIANSLNAVGLGACAQQKKEVATTGYAK